MSLFKARDWWSAALGEGEEFDQGCLCVGDVDNSGTGHGQCVVSIQTAGRLLHVPLIITLSISI